jgi:hypothetical protein
MNLVYGEIVEVVPEDGVLVGRIRFMVRSEKSRSGS